MHSRGVASLGLISFARPKTRQIFMAFFGEKWPPYPGVLFRGEKRGFRSKTDHLGRCSFGPYFRAFSAGQRAAKDHRLIEKPRPRSLEAPRGARRQKTSRPDLPGPKRFSAPVCNRKSDRFCPALPRGPSSEEKTTDLSQKRNTWSDAVLAPIFAPSRQNQ